MIIKFGLLVLSFIIMTVIVFSFEKFKKDWLVYYLASGVVIGQALFPVWFFQGMERMKYITFLNLLAKLIFLVCIFIFVRKDRAYLYVPTFNSLGFIIAGTLSLWVVFRNFGITFKLSDLTSIKHQLKEGWYIFISTMLINMYKVNSILILGIFYNNIIVGYYSIAKKIVDTINQIASIISQSVYPYLSLKVSRGRNVSTLIKSIGIIIFTYTFIIGLCLFFFADLISTLICGHRIYELSISIKLLAFVPLIIGVNVPAVQILLSNKMDRYFSFSVLIGAILDLFLSFTLIPLFSYIGACISVIISEFFVTGTLYYFATNVMQGGRCATIKLWRSTKE